MIHKRSGPPGERIDHAEDRVSRTSQSPLFISTSVTQILSQWLNPEMVHGQGSSCIIRRRGFGAIWRQFQAPRQAQSRANCYPISLPL